MTDWLVLGVLMSEIGLLACLDRTAYGSWVTPFTILALPYATIVMLAALLAHPLGFFGVGPEALSIWIVGLLVFWVGGLGVRLAVGKTVRVRFQERRRPFRYEEDSHKIASGLSWVAIVVMLLGFRAALKSVGGWSAVASDEFGRTYASGFSGHFMALGILLLIFWIGTARFGRKLALVTMSALFIMILGYQVKYLAFVPVVGGVIYRWLAGRLHLSVSKAILYLCVPYAIFSAAYLIAFAAGSIDSVFQADTHKWIARHFIGSLFAGVIGLSESLRTGFLLVDRDPAAAFAPFVNMYALLTSGEFVRIISSQYLPIDDAGTQTSNVHTVFGTLLIQLGVFKAVVYTLYAGAVTYASYAVAVITRSCWLVATFVLLAGGLAFGWFVFLFNNLTFIEVPTYGIILALVFWHRWRGRSVAAERGVIPQALPASDRARPM